MDRRTLLVGHEPTSVSASPRFATTRSPKNAPAVAIAFDTVSAGRVRPRISARALPRALDTSSAEIVARSSS